MSIKQKSQSIWKARTYPAPLPSRRAFRWKAFALRKLHRWTTLSAPLSPVTIMVPAVYNFFPAESVAMGWLNEIDALAPIRQRMVCASKLTGWDVFTFHTLHNLDSYFDSTIAAVRDTWVKEGNLTLDSVREARKKFAKPYDYFRLQARLVENLVFQSSLMDWFRLRAPDIPLRFHVFGTALLSALVSSGALSFGAAVESALKFGARWDDTLSDLAEAQTEDAIGWSRFEQVRKIAAGRSPLALAVAREDLPKVDAPARPFWYSPTPQEPPALISSSQEAAMALETLNIASWSCAFSKSNNEPIRGWLVAALHPVARFCRRSLCNYLLATPAAATLFIEHIALLGRMTFVQPPADSEALQNRFRLSRIKVTGP